MDSHGEETGELKEEQKKPERSEWELNKIRKKDSICTWKTAFSICISCIRMYLCMQKTLETSSADCERHSKRSVECESIQRGEQIFFRCRSFWTHFVDGVLFSRFSIAKLTKSLFWSLSLFVHSHRCSLSVWFDGKLLEWNYVIFVLRWMWWAPYNQNSCQMAAHRNSRVPFSNEILIPICIDFKVYSSAVKLENRSNYNL